MIKENSVYFDSANIAESYSGIVLPLTQSFAQKIYKQVYIDLLKHSGVSGKKLNQHSDIFKNLLGFFYGRMYYNMNNWYLMAAFIPGYKRNKENFELMITSNIKQNITTSIKPSFMFKLLYPLIVMFKLSIYGVTSKYFDFIVKKEIRNFRKRDLGNLQFTECISLYENINKKLLRRWYITVENDFFVMTYLGILKKFLGEKLLQKAIFFASKGTQQIEALSLLSKKMSVYKNLWKAVELGNIKKFMFELSRHKKIGLLLENYLHTFGGRFANELKLESIGLDEDKTKLLLVLKAYRNYKIKKFSTHSNFSSPVFKKIITKFIVSKFKKYATRREEFRLLRSNMFGMARSLFRRMGIILVENKVIEKIDDVFYLKIEEILEPSILKKRDLVNIIKKRKLEYTSYELLNPPSHFVTTNNLPPANEPVTKFNNKVITARPASPGVIRGRVKIFKDFFIPEKIDFDILVTSHTDPGWTSLIALSKGLIIENGGVLSHASIVARELNIPAVIGAKGAVISLKNHQIVEIDGSTGTIRIL